MSTTDPTPTSQSPFPLNRLVAFVGPYVAVLSGIIANWLVVHVHLLAEFHITPGSVSSAIAQISVFGITTLVVWAGHQKWLTGWQKYESEILSVVDKVVPTVIATIPATTTPPATPVPPATPAAAEADDPASTLPSSTTPSVGLTSDLPPVGVSAAALEEGPPPDSGGLEQLDPDVWLAARAAPPAKGTGGAS